MNINELIKKVTEMTEVRKNEITNTQNIIEMTENERENVIILLKNISRICPISLQVFDKNGNSLSKYYTFSIAHKLFKRKRVIFVWQNCICCIKQV